jgi:uncharacterized protein
MPSAMIECELVRIIIDEQRDEQVIFLRETERSGAEAKERRPRIFPIMIGIFEATVIDRILKERRAERPLTHDLLCDTIRQLGGKLLAVRLDELKDDVYFAKLVVDQGGKEVLIDARPSDAIAIALHEKAPVFVSDAILAHVARQEKE